jgi:acetyl esterase/lipase
MLQLLVILLLVAIVGLFAARKAIGLPNFVSLYSVLVSERDVSVQAGVSFGPAARHRLDVYRPKSGDAGGPVALFIYGGNWRTGDRATYGFVGAALASQGITTVVSDYRLFPEAPFPGFVEDAARAYAWVEANIATASGARRPIVVIGHSAGGYNAAMIAFNERYLAAAGASSRPAGLIGLAGPYSFYPTKHPPTKDIFATATSDDEPRPVAFVRSGAPRSLLMYGLKDETVKIENLRDMTAALQAAGTPVRALEFESIGHVGLVVAISRPFRWRAPVLKEMVEFVRAMPGP